MTCVYCGEWLDEDFCSRCPQGRTDLLAHVASVIELTQARWPRCVIVLPGWLQDVIDAAPRLICRLVTGYDSEPFQIAIPVTTN